MAERSGLSESTIGRIWRRFNLKPHQADTFKLSTDALFMEKVVDVVGLYLNPPEGAVVLSVDEKAQIQALNRTQPLLPLRPGLPARQTHDYERNGTTSLYAALEIATRKSGHESRNRSTRILFSSSQTPSTTTATTASSITR